VEEAKQGCSELMRQAARQELDMERLSKALHRLKAPAAEVRGLYNSLLPLESAEARRPGGKMPPDAPRLRIDLQTLSVVLDGTRIRVTNPKALSLYKALADSLGQPLIRAELRVNVKGVRGDKTIRNLLNALPPRLRKTVKSGPEGYWIMLPLPARKKEIRG
jgi:hypothetical protein